MKQIILLDRNIVATIKQKLNGQKVLQSRMKVIRKLDRDFNLISPLLSIKEGKKGFIESDNELENTALNEAKTIKRFFKNAKTDSQFILNQTDDLIEAFQDNTYLKWNHYSKFLIKVNDILYQPIAKTKQMKYKDDIVNQALKLNIDLASPIFQCVLSALFGSKTSRGILKFKIFNDDEKKNKNIYNALNDLLTISMVSAIQATIKKADTKEKIVFVTFDKNLEDFMNSIIFTGNNFTEGIVETEITYSKRLFPNLNEETYLKLQKELIEKNNKAYHSTTPTS